MQAPSTSSQTSESKRVGIVEDDRVTRSYWEALLRNNSMVEFIAAWESAEAFFNDSRRGDVELLLVDLGLPGAGGIDLISRFKASQPETACIVLTASSDPEDVFGAIRAGASGYLVKQASPQTLLGDLNAILADGMTFSPQIAKMVVEEFLRADRPAVTDRKAAMKRLTQRESEVLEALAARGNAKDVAVSLGLSHETVRVHMKKIYQKLHVTSKAEAVAVLAQSRLAGA